MKSRWTPHDAISILFWLIAFTGKAEIKALCVSKVCRKTTQADDLTRGSQTVAVDEQIRPQIFLASSATGPVPCWHRHLL